MMILNYRLTPKTFDPALLGDMDESMPQGSYRSCTASSDFIAAATPLRPIVAEAETPDTCIACRQPVIAFTGSYDNGKGFRLDGASMERCGCGERLTPRRSVQPDAEVVTAHSLASMVRIQQQARTVKCASRKCAIEFDLVGSEYRMYCCVSCRKAEIMARRLDRKKEERRLRREAAALEKPMRDAIREARRSTPRALTFASAVA